MRHKCSCSVPRPASSPLSAAWTNVWQSEYTTMGPAVPNSLSMARAYNSAVWLNASLQTLAQAHKPI
eukprot:6474719-Amphidinium_carterae.1